MNDAWSTLRGYPSRARHRLIGLMTGTSADAVDAALVSFEGEGAEARPRLEAYREFPLAPVLRAEVLEVAGIESLPLERLMALDEALGEAFADAVRNLLASTGVASREVDAIGSHGQTVRHVPRAAGGGRARTLQIGSSAILAERTGIAVVSGFRSRDTAAGGEGAPLVPIVDAWLFGSAGESRALLNLGGMANLTFLPRGGGLAGVMAFDTGPGNVVMDALAERRSAGAERFDAGGAFAATGRVHEGLLAELLADPFFALPPPRSTGRERFGAEFARGLAARGKVLGIGEADLARTALELTAASVADAISRFVNPRGLDAVYASGGGVANTTLMDALARRLSPLPVRSLETLGIAPGAKEAMAFAMLAHLTLCGLAGNLPSATGASRPVVLGHVTPGS